jgi:hypothetical protein
MLHPPADVLRRGGFERNRDVTTVNPGRRERGSDDLTLLLKKRLGAVNAKKAIAAD